MIIILSLFERLDMLYFYVQKALSLNWANKRENLSIIGVSHSVEFSDLKKSLWNTYAEKLFPYVEEVNEYADVSPLVCSGTTISNINVAKGTYLICRLLSLEEISALNFEFVEFLFSNEEVAKQQVEILKEADFEVSILRPEVTLKHELKSFLNHKRQSSVSSSFNSEYNSNQSKNSTMYNSNKNYSSNYTGGNGSTGPKKEYPSKEYPNNQNNFNYKKTEKAIIVIKPKVIANGQEFHLANHLLTNGICVSYLSRKRLSVDVWKEFYLDSSFHPWYSTMCSYLASAHVYIGIIEGEGVIAKTRAMIGDKDPSKCEPHQMRKIFGDSLEDNGIHISSSVADYEREKNALFVQRRN